ncbi:hypothetical protein Sjap_020002 [Stephania japonica]|uniref:Uncharacterized protein n=1 Tax=Stephania japonica TaxID=461633 RepID=A0AAP0HV97_9MAGN
MWTALQACLSFFHSFSSFLSKREDALRFIILVFFVPLFSINILLSDHTLPFHNPLPVKLRRDRPHFSVLSAPTSVAAQVRLLSNLGCKSFEKGRRQRFFKVRRRQRGGIIVSESKSQAEFIVVFTDQETFWLARICKKVCEAGDKAQRESLRKNGASNMFDVLNDTRGKALKTWKLVGQASQAIIIPEGSRDGGCEDWIWELNTTSMVINKRLRAASPKILKRTQLVKVNYLIFTLDTTKTTVVISSESNLKD